MKRLYGVIKPIVKPPPLLITPLPPLVPTLIFLLPLPSRVFLQNYVHLNYASPNLLVPILRPMPLRKTNLSTSAVFWLARRVNGTTLSSKMTPFFSPPPTPFNHFSRKWMTSLEAGLPSSPWSAPSSICVRPVPYQNWPSHFKTSQIRFVQNGPIILSFLRFLRN